MRLSYAEEQSVQPYEQNEQLMQFADYEDFHVKLRNQRYRDWKKESMYLLITSNPS